MDNELLLFDRLEVIRNTIQQYDEENFYISFSGGKDSTVVHHLVDMALPENQIPRVFSNTGIEYQAIVEFVKSLAENDDRFVLIQPSVPIKKTLENKGYPFKSKQYSHGYRYFQKYLVAIKQQMEIIEENPELLESYDFIHNLPYGTKWTIKEYYGKREREREVCTSMQVAPDILKYQFTKGVSFKISDSCCVEMKEKPLKQWEKKNGIKNYIAGLMREEGGRRSNVGCIYEKKNKVAFYPLAPMTTEWEDWFIKRYNIQLCKLYYPPFNFKRTGCKGCPFALDLQEELSLMDIYLPAERKQCEIIWEPVYKEYRRIGYRLKKEEQMKLF